MVYPSLRTPSSTDSSLSCAFEWRVFAEILLFEVKFYRSQVGIQVRASCSCISSGVCWPCGILLFFRPLVVLGLFKCLPSVLGRGAPWGPTLALNPSPVQGNFRNVHCKKGALFGHLFPGGCKKGALKCHFWAPFLHCTFSGLAGFRSRLQRTPPVPHSWRPTGAARVQFRASQIYLHFPRLCRRGRPMYATQ